MLSGGGASPPESKHPYEWRNLDYGNLTAAPCQVPIATQVFPARVPLLKQDVDAISVIAGHSVAHWYRGPSTSFVRRGGLTALRMTAEKHAASAQHDIRQRFCSVRISLRRGAVTVRSFPFWNDCFDFGRNCLDSFDVGANDGYGAMGNGLYATRPLFKKKKKKKFFFLLVQLRYYCSTDRGADVHADMSTNPLTARAASESVNERDTPNTIMLRRTRPPR